MKILRLREIIEAKGITGKKLAQDLGVTEASISNLVKGESIPRKKMLIALSEYLETPIAEFFVGYNSRKPDCVEANVTHVPQAMERAFLAGTADPLDLTPWYLPDVRGKCISFLVKDESMLNTLRPGETIVCNYDPVPFEELTSGLAYAVGIEGKVITRRIRKHNDPKLIWLVTDNDLFEDEEVEWENLKFFYARRNVTYVLKEKMRYEE